MRKPHLSFAIAPEMMKRLAILASREERSIAGQARHIIKEHLVNEKLTRVERQNQDEVSHCHS